MEAIGRWVRSRETGFGLFGFLPSSAVDCQVSLPQTVSRPAALPGTAMLCCLYAARYFEMTLAAVLSETFSLEHRLERSYRFSKQYGV